MSEVLTGFITHFPTGGNRWNNSQPQPPWVSQRCCVPWSTRWWTPSRRRCRLPTAWPRIARASRTPSVPTWPSPVPSNVRIRRPWPSWPALIIIAKPKPAFSTVAPTNTWWAARSTMVMASARTSRAATATRPSTRCATNAWPPGDNNEEGPLRAPPFFLFDFRLWISSKWLPLQGKETWFLRVGVELYKKDLVTNPGLKLRWIDDPTKIDTVPSV